MMKKGLYYSIVKELNKLPWKKIWKNYQAEYGNYYYRESYKQPIKLDKNTLRKLISHSIFKYCNSFINRYPLDSFEGSELITITLFNININWTSGGWKVTLDYKYGQLHLENYSKMLKHESKQGYQQASKYLTRAKLKK